MCENFQWNLRSETSLPFVYHFKKCLISVDMIVFFLSCLIFVKSLMCESLAYLFFVWKNNHELLFHRCFSMNFDVGGQGRRERFMVSSKIMTCRALEDINH